MLCVIHSQCGPNLKVDLDYNKHVKIKDQGSKKIFIDFLIIHAIGDRCEAKSSFR